jgi:hypothetical protein
MMERLVGRFRNLVAMPYLLHPVNPFYFRYLIWVINLRL